MVTTRKKARISYIEQPEVDEDQNDEVAEALTPAASTSVNPAPAAPAIVVPAQEGDEEDPKDLFVPGQRRKKPKKRIRKSVVPVPRKAAFDHSQILELPTDVLCTILSFLPPATLYNVSVSSKKFAHFLQSKSSSSVWMDSRRRLTERVPKTFLNSRDWQTSPPSDPLRHYDFPMRAVISTPEDERKEIEAEEDDESKVALAVPEPPEGISEFSMARYLFCNICYHCGRECRATTIKVPELLAHFCKGCFSSHTSLYKNALTDFEQTLEPDAFSEIPDFTEYLLTLPAWKHQNHHHSEAVVEVLRPKDRRIYSHGLDTGFAEFKKKKSSMSSEDFRAWLKRIMKSNEEKRLQASRVTEYIWLQKTHSQYAYRMTRVITERNRKRFHDSLLDRTVQEISCSRTIAEKIFDSHDYRFSRYINKEFTEDLWEQLRPIVQELMKSYQDWRTANPFWVDQATNQQVSVYCAELTESGGALSPRLHPGHFLTLPRLKEVLCEAPEGQTPAERRQWVTQKLSEMREDLRTDLSDLCTEFKRDLVRKVIDAETAAAESTRDELAETEEVPTPSDKVEGMSHAELQAKLDEPDSVFACTLCKHAVSWRQMGIHDCIANDTGEQEYGDNLRYMTKKCTPIGYQPDRLELAKGYQGLHKVLKGIALKYHEDLGYFHRCSFPATHLELQTDHTWKLGCKLPTCYHVKRRVCDYIKHTAAHICSGDTTLAQLSAAHRPTITGESVDYNYGSSDYDSDDMYMGPIF